MTGIKGMKGGGGKRKGAGRKLKYGEPTQRLMFQVPKSKVKEFKKVISALLKQWEVN